jgi:hypothetical protein
VPPATAFSLIQELKHRDGLRIALAGRDDVLLEPILHLLLKHVADPRFGQLVCELAGTVISMCACMVLARYAHGSFRYVHSSTRPVTAHRQPLLSPEEESIHRACIPTRTIKGSRRVRYDHGSGGIIYE